jgi:hypothetical protein
MNHMLIPHEWLSLHGLNGRGSVLPQEESCKKKTQIQILWILY